MTETTETTAMNTNINVANDSEPDKPEVNPIDNIDKDNLKAGDLGIQLKHCRTQAELDVEQAAEEMRLPVSTLLALEAENFEELPEPPYVRGYLRSYSRLNDSDASLLIRTYEQLRGSHTEDVSFSPATSLNRVAKPPLSPATVKVTALGILVALLGVLWFIPGVSHWATGAWDSFSQQTTDPQPLNTPVDVVDGSISRDNNLSGNSNSISMQDVPGNSAANTTITLPNSTQTNTQNTQNNATNAGNNAVNNSEVARAQTQSADNAQSNTSIGNTSDASPQNTNNTNAGETTASVANSATTTTQTNMDASETPPLVASARGIDTNATANITNASSDSSNTQELTAGNSASANSTANNDNPTTTEATATANNEASASLNADPLSPSAATPSSEVPIDFNQPINGDVTVRLEFSGESWTQVKDSRGRAIFEALNSANTWKSFKARPPLSFVVGNAPNVKVYFNGQLYNQNPYTRGSVARFKIN